jgi:hypothetical protein
LFDLLAEHDLRWGDLERYQHIGWWRRLERCLRLFLDDQLDRFEPFLSLLVITIADAH